MSDAEGFYSSEEDLPKQPKPKAPSTVSKASTAPKKRKQKTSQSSETKTKNKQKPNIDIETYKRRKVSLSELFGSDDEVEEAAAVTASSKIQELESVLTKKVGDGTLRRSAKLDGALFCELRVYETRDIKNVSAKDRWTKAYTSLKYQFYYDSPEWGNIIDLITHAKKRFTEEPVYYPNKK